MLSTTMARPDALVAQLVEQLPFKEKVLGSIPSEGTIETKSRLLGILCFGAGRSVVFV